MIRTFVIAVSVGSLLGGCAAFRQQQAQKAFAQAEAACVPSSFRTMIQLVQCHDDKESLIWERYWPDNYDLYLRFADQRYVAATKYDADAPTNTQGAMTTFIGTMRQLEASMQREVDIRAQATAQAQAQNDARTSQWFDAIMLGVAGAAQARANSDAAMSQTLQQTQRQRLLYTRCHQATAAVHVGTINMPATVECTTTNW